MASCAAQGGAELEVRGWGEALKRRFETGCNRRPRPVERAMGSAGAVWGRPNRSTALTGAPNGGLHGPVHTSAVGPGNSHRPLPMPVASSALRPACVFWPGLPPRPRLGVRRLGLYPGRRTSWSVVVGDLGGHWVTRPALTGP